MTDDLWTPDSRRQKRYARQVLLVARLRTGPTTQELARLLGVTRDCIHRDLRELEAAGAVERTSGRGPNVSWVRVEPALGDDVEVA